MRFLDSNDRKQLKQLDVSVYDRHNASDRHASLEQYGTHSQSDCVLDCPPERRVWVQHDSASRSWKLQRPFFGIGAVAEDSRFFYGLSPFEPHVGHDKPASCQVFEWQSGILVNELHVGSCHKLDVSITIVDKLWHAKVARTRWPALSAAGHVHASPCDACRSYHSVVLQL